MVVCCHAFWAPFNTHCVTFQSTLDPTIFGFKCCGTTLTMLTATIGFTYCSKFLLCLLKQPKTQGTKVSRKTELVSILVIVTLNKGLD
jgi:hypothetical protein